MANLTLAAVQAKITETETAITKVKTAQGYAKGDKSVQRARLTELEAELSRLRRDERILTNAGNSNANNAMAISASWNSV